jgi:hypothetical protein
VLSWSDIQVGAFGLERQILDRQEPISAAAIRLPSLKSIRHGGSTRYRDNAHEVLKFKASCGIRMSVVSKLSKSLSTPTEHSTIERRITVLRGGLYKLHMGSAEGVVQRLSRLDCVLLPVMILLHARNMPVRVSLRKDRAMTCSGTPFDENRRLG